MRLRWYLVSVNDCVTQTLRREPVTFFCSFLRRHSTDKRKFDSAARWWPEWREISWNNDGTFEYGASYQLGSRANLDFKRYSVFGSDIVLPNGLFHSPFNFLPQAPGRSGISFIYGTNWAALATACEKRSIAPPTLPNLFGSTDSVAHFRTLLPAVKPQGFSATDFLLLMAI